MTTPIRVLIVDDEAVVRESLLGFLEDQGFEVTGAAGAAEALRALGQRPFDAAVVDLGLPGGGGEDFVRQAHALAPALRFLIYTGSVDYRPSPDLEPLGVSARNVLTKPVPTLSTVSDRIRETVGAGEGSHAP